MIDRILKKSYSYTSPAACPMATVSFEGLEMKTKARLLDLGYSPPLQVEARIRRDKDGRPLLIGGEMVCYPRYLFGDY